MVFPSIGWEPRLEPGPRARERALQVLHFDLRAGSMQAAQRYLTSSKPGFPGWSVRDGMIRAVWACDSRVSGPQSPLAFINLVDCADVGVIEGRGAAGLTKETLQRVLIPGKLLGEKLQSHVSAELGVFGLVHHTHASSAELLQYAVV